MNAPRDPKSAQPKNPNQPIDVRHQLGLVATAGMVPQPGQPHLPRVEMPMRSSNIAALGGTKMEKG